MSDLKVLRDYFNSLATSLDADSRSSSFGGHKPDTGANREALLIKLLNKHLPGPLEAVSGGRVLNIAGAISKQVDVIVTNHLFPKFGQHEKTCVLAEAVAGVMSVKSTLDKAALEESIENVASVPAFSEKALSLSNSSLIRPELQQQFFANWPFRVVFAYDGIDPDTLYKHALAYYQSYSGPKNLLPEMIIVNRKLCIRFLRDGGSLNDGTKLPPNWLQPLTLKDSTSGYPIAGIITTLNNYVPWMHYMKFNFSPYIDCAFQ